MRRWPVVPSRTMAVTLRSLLPAVFLPALVYEIGNAAVAPIVALTALDLGATTATAGLILTLIGVGQIAGNVPSSALVSRLGDRRAMMVAALISAGGARVVLPRPGPVCLRAPRHR